MKVIAEKVWELDYQKAVILISYRDNTITLIERFGEIKTIGYKHKPNFSDLQKIMDSAINSKLINKEEL